MIDFHTHLLPGIDDGAAAIDESVAMARILASCGFTVAHCTPHLIKGGYETAPARVREMTASLQKVYDAAGIPVRLVPGTEHYLDEFLEEFLAEAVTVSGSRYLLVEVPFRCTADTVSAHAGNLLRRETIPLFAHPERCTAFVPREEGRGLLGRLLRRKKEPTLEGTLLSELKGSGCLFQANLGSFAGVYGEEVRQRALLFLREGAYACVGSDAHRVERLEAVVRRGIAVVEETIGEEAARRLLQGETVSNAICSLM